jgi:hypothetical protein
VNPVFQGFFHYELKMRRLGAVAVRILAFVLIFLDRIVENALGILNVFTDFRQVRDLHWRTVLPDNVHQGYTVKDEFIIFYAKFFAGKFKGLFNEINVALHLDG